MLQYIAGSLLGPRSYTGGLASAELGLFLHLAVSLVVATIYIFANRRIAVLRTQCVVVGLLYGAAVWAVMNLLMLPSDQDSVRYAAVFSEDPAGTSSGTHISLAFLRLITLNCTAGNT